MSTENLDGRFTVKGPLRCSGVGSLMCAEDKDGARTAIRLIPQVAQGKEAIAAALRMPLHPVLPRTLGSGAFNGSSWVAIDFPEGELLKNRLPLSTPSLLTMGSMIAGALAALHEKDIIHGELSAESVLVIPATGGERFVLFDAPLVVMNRLTDRRGEERLLAQLTHLVPFLSPERARGAEATQAGDVWSLGMILSLASGAKGIPGESTLEKIAAIVTNKWRPAVSPSLPIALRLLLTRMLAPEPKDRPSSLDAAIELEHLSVALTAHQNVVPHAAPLVDTAPVAQFRIDKLVEQTRETPPADPFEALVAAGVTAVGLDAHAEPTRRMGIPLTAELRPGHDVTDPHAMVPIPAAVPTAPSGPIWVEPATSATVKLDGDASPIPLLIPAHPSQQKSREAATVVAAEPQRRTPLPLPPILDPAAVVVAPQPARHLSPSPMPKPAAHASPDPHQAHAQTQTMRFGALPGAVREPRVPAVLTEDVAEEAAAARAEARAEVPPVPTSPVVARSVHDDAEDAFAADVRRGQQRRYLIAAIAAGVVILVLGGFLVKSAFDGEPETAAQAPRKVTPEVIEAVKAQAVRAKAEAAAKAKAAKVAEPEEVAELEEPQPEPVAAKPEPEPVAAKPEPKPEPVAAKPEPKPAPVAKAEPAPKPEPVAKAEPAPKPAPVAKAAPASDLKRPEEVKPEPRPAATARPARQVRSKVEEAPRRPASRLDEGD